MPRIINIKGDIIPNSNKWFYNYFGYDSTCPNDVIKVLQEVKGTEDIILEVASGGGSVFAAHEIYNALASYKGNVEAHVVSLAGSAASEIIMAVKSKISPVASLMIHNCSTYASGDYRDMDSASNMLKTTNQAIRNAYKAKTGLSDEQLSKYMDDATWMSAETAVELGFVDEIMELNNEPSNHGITNNTIPTLYNSAGLVINQDKIKELRAMITNKDLSSVLMIDKELSTEEDIKKISDMLNQDNKPLVSIANDEEPVAFIDNKENIGGENNMTLQEVIDKYPELKNEIDTMKVAAIKEGEEAERNRLQEIDSISASIPEKMVQDAMFNNPCTASELSFQFIQNEATKGKRYLEDAKNDSKESKVEDINADPSAELKNSSKDDDELLASIIADSANQNRKGVK